MSPGTDGDRMATAWMRIGPEGRLVVVAALLSAGKVLLYTCGATLVLVRDGVESLPAVYLLLAVLATIVSIGLSGLIDRLGGHRLMPGLTVAVVLGVGLLIAALAAGWSPAPTAILLAAHLYDIVTDIVFWVLAAAFFDNLRLRRLTPRFYIAIAAGGSVAGILAERALALITPEHLLWPVVGLACLALLALGPAPATQAGDDEDSGAPLLAPGELRRFLGQHPFALLLALNSLLLTVVYSITEFVCFALYAEAYADEAELGRFMALLFAVLQVAELVMLWLAARGVVERCGPMLRNLLFPLSSLVCLAALLLQPRIGWAIVAHVNTEAVSNAVFEPVNTTNYTALPVAVLGRARTLADGVFYPLGMAVAGAVLALLPAGDAAFRATVLALVATGFFVALNLAVARSYLPTLILQIRHGVGTMVRNRRLAPLALDRLATLMASRREADRRLALDLVEAAVDGGSSTALAGLARPLADLAPRLVESEWARVAALLARLDPAELRAALDAARAEAWVPAIELLAAAHLLAGRPLTRSDLAPASGPFLEALVELVGDSGPRALQRIGRTTIDGRLVAIIRRAPPDLVLRLADRLLATGAEPLRLALLDALHGFPPERLTGTLGRLAWSALDAPSPSHRAAALALIAPTLRPAARAELARRALGDPSRQVRRVAVDVLKPQADLVLAELGHGELEDATGINLGLIELVAALDGRAARRLLRRLTAGLAAAAEHDALLLDRVTAIGDPSLAPLQTALLDHAHGLSELLFAGLAALGEAERASQLRQALREVDLRLVAGGIDGLASLRNSQLARRFIPLLEQLHLPSGAHAASDPMPISDLLAEIEMIGDRWLWAAVRLVSRPHDPQTPAPSEAAMPTLNRRRPGSGDDTNLLERMLRLKRFELMNELPLGALETALDRIAERRFAAGMQVQRAGGPLLHAWLIDEGRIEVRWPDGAAESLGAGEMIGEAALADPTVAAPEITAASPCRLFLLHRVAFQDLSRDHTVLTEALCRLLARRLRQRRAATARAGERSEAPTPVAVD